MLKLKKLSSAIALASISAFAQADGTLEGRIVDAQTQNPINGVVVSIKDLDREVLVNNKGAFACLSLKPVPTKLWSHWVIKKYIRTPSL
jgi:hypothetical protein